MSLTMPRSSRHSATPSALSLIMFGNSNMFARLVRSFSSSSSAATSSAAASSSGYAAAKPVAYLKTERFKNAARYSATLAVNALIFALISSPRRSWIGLTVSLTSGTIFLMASHCARASSRRLSLAEVLIFCAASSMSVSSTQSSSRSTAALRVFTLYSAPITLSRKSKDSSSLSGSSDMPNAPSVVLKNFSSASICFVTPFFITPVNVKDSAREPRSSFATTSKRFPPLEDTFSRVPPWSVASSPVGVAIAGSARYTRVHSCVCKSYENASLIGFAPDMPPNSISDSFPAEASMAKARASGSTAPFSGIASAVTTLPSARRTKKSSRSTSASSSSLRCTPPNTYTASPAAHIAAPFRGLNNSPSTVCSTQASDPPLRSSVTKSSMETSSLSPPKMTNFVGVSMVIAGPWRLVGGPRGATSSSSGSGSGSGSGLGSASGTIGLPSSSSSGSGGGTGLPSSSSSGPAGAASSVGSSLLMASSAGGSSSAGGGVSGAAGGSSASAGAASSGLASAASGAGSSPSAAAFSAAAASAAASSAASFSSRITWWRDFIAR